MHIKGLIWWESRINQHGGIHGKYFKNWKLKKKMREEYLHLRIDFMRSWLAGQEAGLAFKPQV